MSLRSARAFKHSLEETFHMYLQGSEPNSLRSAGTFKHLLEETFHMYLCYYLEQTAVQADHILVFI